LTSFLSTSNPLNSLADTSYRIDGIDSKTTFSINTSNTHAVLALTRRGSSYGTVVLDTSLITPAGSIVTQKFPNRSGTFTLAPVKIGSDLSLGSGSNGTVTVTGYNYILIKIFRETGGVNHIGDTLINLGDTNEFSTTIRTRYIVWHDGGFTVNGNITVQSSSGLRIVNNLGSGTTTFRVYGIV